MALSRSQIDKLGARLRKSDTVSPDDLALLQQYIDAHAPAQAHVVDTLRQGLTLRPGPVLADVMAAHLDAVLIEALQAADVTQRYIPDPTARLKTRDTTLDKLRRRPTRLSTIQDIAGCRIVLLGEIGRLTQQMLVIAVQELFPGSRVLDRCVAPSHGYRAVHVIASVAGLHVEVQVRTSLQDRWAQVYEGLADYVGRQIRYGESPDEPHRPMREGDASRQWTVERMQSLGDALADAEEKVRPIEGARWLAHLWESVLSPSSGPAIDQFPEIRRLAGLAGALADSHRSIEAEFDRIRRMLDEQGGS